MSERKTMGVLVQQARAELYNLSREEDGADIPEHVTRALALLNEALELPEPKPVHETNIGLSWEQLRERAATPHPVMSMIDLIGLYLAAGSSIVRYEAQVEAVTKGGEVEPGDVFASLSLLIPKGTLVEPPTLENLRARLVAHAAKHLASAVDDLHVHDVIIIATRGDLGAVEILESESFRRTRATMRDSLVCRAAVAQRRHIAQWLTSKLAGELRDDDLERVTGTVMHSDCGVGDRELPPHLKAVVEEPRFIPAKDGS